jgi:hypothetical protein
MIENIMKILIYILSITIVSSSLFFAGFGQSLMNNEQFFDYLSKKQNATIVTDTIYLVPDTTAFVTEFGFYGQDRMLQWFKAPTDLFLKKVGFAFCGSWSDSIPVELRFIKNNYPEDSLEYLSNKQYGWYEALGNSYNDITAFLDDPDRTGGWFPSPGAPDTTEIFGHCVYWPFDCLTGYFFIPEYDSINVKYQWIDLGPLGYFDIPSGAIFGVALKNTFPVLEDGRIEIRGTEVGLGGTNQYSLWKFYAEDGPQPGTSYGWWSRDITLAYAIIVDKVVPVEDETKPVYEFKLEQNYPNPFNPSTKIKFTIPASDSPLLGGARCGLVTLKVYDVLGKEVATLVNEEKPAGSYEVDFDGKDIASGIYFYQLKAGKYIETKKMVLIK